MISVIEAKTLIAAHLKPLKAKTVSIDGAQGLILSENLYALYDIPAFKQSSVDGYAIKFSDKDSKLSLAGELAAGGAKILVMESGQSIRVFTGAPIPEAADTVVMQEKASREQDHISILDKQLTAGANVREKGAEIKTGALAMPEGSQLSPAAIGFLAGIGFSALPVVPRPRVSVVLTGNELRQPGVPLEFGQVYDSSSYALRAALQQSGVTEIELIYLPDNLEGMLEKVSQALEESAVVILTGGVSVGDYDLVPKALELCGVRKCFHGIRQRPGKPMYFGTRDTTLVFGLPGNPSSVLSCFYNYVLPAVCALSGKQSPVTRLRVRLSSSYKKELPFTFFLKGYHENGWVRQLGAQESFRLSSFAQANCLIEIGEEQQSMEKGDMVEVLIFP